MYLTLYQASNIYNNKYIDLFFSSVFFTVFYFLFHIISWGHYCLQLMFVL